MKKNKIILLLLIVVCLTGCTKQLKNEQNKPVVYEKTGQSLTANILCQPTNKDVKSIYETVNEQYKKTLDKQYKNHEITTKKYNQALSNIVNINELPKCTELKIVSNNYEGIWNTIFVNPLAWLIIKIGILVKNYGLSVIIASFLIRLAVLPLTKKTILQSENMKKAKPELDKIEQKYADRKDQESMTKKSQEMMIVYKKHNINPLSGCLFAFIQLPMFFAFLEAINRVPAIFENKFLVFQLGTTPLVGIMHQNYWYIILIILIIATTYYSLKLNGTDNSNDDLQKQMQFMTKFMLIMISVTSLTLPAATALYWITSSLFTIIQNLYVKRSKKK